MNILIITTILPYPLTSGGAQAQFNMIEELRKHHHIHILFTQDRNNRLKYMRQLQKLWSEVTFIPYLYIWQMSSLAFLYNKFKRGVQVLFTPNNQDFIVDRAIRPICIQQTHRLENFINRVIDRYHINVVQVEFFPAINLVRCLPTSVRKIFIQHEIHYIRNERYLQPLTLSAKQQEQYAQSRKYEIDAMNQYDVVVTLTDHDRDQLIQDGVLSQIVVSPAAVNATMQLFSGFNGFLSFVGASNHLPNQEGLRWLLNDVSQFLPSGSVRLNVIGKGWNIASVQDKIQVHNLGFVQNLSQAIGGTILVVPILSGSGMRMKILEAAAASVPFITTSVGVEGLNFIDGQSCIIADTPKAFAESIIRLLMDNGLRQSLAENALAIYKQNYTPQKLAQKRNEIYS